MDILLLVLGIVCLHYNKHAVTFLILMGFLTSYYLMGSNLSNFIVPHNLSDTGMLLYFYMLVYGSTQKKRYDYPILSKFFWPLFTFGLILLLSILYDYARGTSMLSIIQCHRHWLLLFLAVPLLRCYSITVYQQLIRYMLYISVVATVLILLDHYIGTQILHADAGLFISKSGEAFKRGAIPTSYCIFFIFLLLTDYFKDIKPQWRYVLVGLLLLSVIASMIRSMLFSVILGIVLILYIIGKIRLSNLGTLFFGTCIFIGVVFSTPGLRERISLGINEVNTLSPNSAKKEKGNLSFRLDLAAERYNYVVAKWDRMLFGIGSIREKDFPTTFKTGLYNSKIGRAVQLDTSDIAWPLLILRLGLLGTVIIIYIWSLFLQLFHRYENHLAKGTWTFLLVSIPISFCAASIANGYFWFFILLLLVVVSETDSKSQQLLV